MKCEYVSDIADWASISHDNQVVAANAIAQRIVDLWDQTEPGKTYDLRDVSLQGRRVFDYSIWSSVDIPESFRDPTSKTYELLGKCIGMDPDLFFPERGYSNREAKETCGECIVKDACLGYALANGEKFGIWGGKTERERRRILRGRSAA